MKELVTFRKYLNEGVVKEDEFDDLLDSGLSYKEIKAKHKDKLRAAAIAYLEGDEGDDYDDILKKLDDFDDEEGIKKAPKKQRKPGELGDLNHADGTPKSNDELDAELNDEIDNLSKDMFNEEIEKEDIDNMDDLEDNAEYQEAYNNIGANAVEENDSKIDYKILDKELKEFLSYYNITFEVNLREKLFYDGLEAIKEYR